ncbi:hypothetical protein GMORB2_2909 [Geosmithia morbida]|uniref:cyclin-dependent kinase n=1 Tax=Geosmithia morbida TaxID=1094350 RepID=A0A9P4YNZ9_9HYPO|nr:uncharacterized protein GMORB2_2909 [Geosmithia morbida]KAF4120471.1 hypothetical protein GMORB2_2909 [Geosmithia morbida]
MKDERGIYEPQLQEDRSGHGMKSSGPSRVTIVNPRDQIPPDTPIRTGAEDETTTETVRPTTELHDAEKGPHLAPPEPGDKARRRSRSRGRRDSPHSPSKRHRSRSRSPGHRHRKKSKRHSSSSHRARDYDESASSRHRRRHSPHRRRRSPTRVHASPRRRDGDDDEERSPRQRRYSGPESPMDTGSCRFRRDSQYSMSDAPRGPHSRSPVPSGRHESRARRPDSRDRHGPAPALRNPSASGLGRRPSSNDAPRSPRAHRDQRRRRHQETPEHWSSTRSDVDDEMASRGGYRDVPVAGYQPAYSQQRPQYHNDPRGYSQSPQPPHPYRDSPGHSPYGGGGGGRSGWGSNFSPSHQYPPPYTQGSGSYGPPAGFSGPYPPERPRSPPQGPHRGSSRGRGFRTSSFSSGGRQRGPDADSGGHWDVPSDSGRDRRPFDEAPPAANGDGRPSPDDVDMDRPPSDDQADVPPPPKQQDQDGAQGRPPASGSGKFSFAFKPSKPATAAAPKPEISQKLNAVAPRKVSLDRSQSGRAPPPSAPTEPASARARYEPSKAPPEGPRAVPRTRKVKKMIRRPKPRPTLAPEHAASDSVFFRKPGNESVVGSGTYGKVFKGLNVYTKDLVALKRIRMEGERDGFPVTAVREIKLLQSLRHANIVNLQEVMVERNDCFMVFEYLSHDLTGLLNHPTFKLDESQKKHLASQLLEGLDYLHTRGVLHRDIKAANVLVSSTGVLKLADFGLARFYAKHHNLDYTNRVITIWYRSPELLLGETRYTAAVDVWSAACVMVEIFCRSAIFPGDGTELSQLDKIYAMMGTPTLADWPGLVDMAWFELLKPTVKRRSMFAEKYKARLSPAAFDLVLKMLHYDPAKRPTAAQVLSHAYFVDEEPLPKQAIELTGLGGDWHEFESKALRKENERREFEARKASSARDNNNHNHTVNSNNDNSNSNNSNNNSNSNSNNNSNNNNSNNTTTTTTITNTNTKKRSAEGDGDENGSSQQKNRSQPVKKLHVEDDGADVPV